MKKSLLFFAIIFFCLSVSAQSQTIPKSAFYGGFGGSFNFVNFSATEANTLGLSNVFIAGTNVTSGSAKGPFEVAASSENRFGPFVQLGYYQKFNKSAWLFGGKFTYSYIGATSTSPEQDIPQYGSNTAGKTFDGVAVVQSYETSIYSQFTLTPYFGYSSKRTFFYLGAGPSYSYTKENINGVVGWAFVNGDTVNISGNPTDFSSSDWVWGFTAVAGSAYFFNQFLFLDLCYNFNSSGSETNDYTAPFANSSGIFSTTGELVGRTTRSLISNSVTLTLNAAF